MRVDGILWRCWDRGLFLIKKKNEKRFGWRYRTSLLALERSDKVYLDG